MLLFLNLRCLEWNPLNDLSVRSDNSSEDRIPYTYLEKSLSNGTEFVTCVLRIVMRETRYVMHLVNEQVDISARATETMTKIGGVGSKSNAVSSRLDTHCDGF
jgi:hypothetical protein